MGLALGYFPNSQTSDEGAAIIKSFIRKRRAGVHILLGVKELVCSHFGVKDRGLPKSARASWFRSGKISLATESC
jgi:hypothetical protein